MTSSSHHVSCLTDDPEAVHTFLTEVVGLEVTIEFTSSGADMTRLAGWPESDGADVRMYGKPPAGIVEVVAIPEALRDRVNPRILLVSFATPDLPARVDAARRLGFDAADPAEMQSGEVDIAVSMVDVGGITWEFVSFR